MAEKTEARKKAEMVERQGRFNINSMSPFIPPVIRSAVIAAKGGNRPPLDDDEMDQLTREVGRGMRPRSSQQNTSSAAQAAMAEKSDQDMRKKMGQRYDEIMPDPYGEGKAKGGSIKGYAKGGKIDGCAQRGKTRGRMV